MAKNNQNKQDENLENVQEALSASGQWIEKNQNALTWCVTIIVLVVCGIIALNTYVWKPKAAAASRLAEESSRKKHSSAFALI